MTNEHMANVAGAVADSIFRDAERYRWLRDRAPWALANIAYGASPKACEHPQDDPDAAIDAAMKDQPGKA